MRVTALTSTHRSNFKAYRREGKTTQIAKTSLPFRVRIVRNEEQLDRAVQVRASAYARHFPTLKESLQNPEPDDWNPSSVIFLAESKEDSRAVGTMRVDTNLYSPLKILQSIALPEHILTKPFAYVTRLGVIQGHIGSLAKLALFKTLHRYCLAKQISNIVVGAHPPTDRDYERLEFSDIFEKRHLHSIPSSFGIPLRFMFFETNGAERRWRTTGNPLYTFMFETFHPDIEIFLSVNGMWTNPRNADSILAQQTGIIQPMGIPLI